MILSGYYFSNDRKYKLIGTDWKIKLLCKFSKILGNMYVSYTILSSGTVNGGLPGNRNWTVSVCLKCLIGVPLESTTPQPYTIISCISCWIYIYTNRASINCNVVLKCFICNPLLLIINSRSLFLTKKESNILQAQCTHFRHTHRASWLFPSFRIQWRTIFYNWNKGADIWLPIIYSMLGGVTSLNESVVLFFFLHMWWIIPKQRIFLNVLFNYVVWYEQYDKMVKRKRTNGLTMIYKS